MADSVVITGMGLVTSLGRGMSETWDALISGNSGIRYITSFDARGFDCTSAAEVHGLGPEDLNIHPKDSRIMDKHAYMLMKAGRDAFTMAGLHAGAVAPERIGFFAAMGMVDYTIEDILPSIVKSRGRNGTFEYDRFFSGGYQEIYPLWPLSMLNNIGFCQVAIDLGIKGENTVFSPHGDSFVHAIVEACHVVSEKKADVVLAGGVSEKISPQSLARASLSGILNISGTQAEQSCNPFGKDREGTLLGEGCGVLALELKSSAKKRGLPELASITGYGASCEPDRDAHCPHSRAIHGSMDQALSRAGIRPSDIDVIIAHGDGTGRGDRNEAAAIHHTFRDSLDRLYVYTSKGAIGNLLAGAPAADMIIGICILENGIIPPRYATSSEDNDILFSLVRAEPVRADIRRIMINTRSHEGQCASLIIEKTD